MLAVRSSLANLDWLTGKCPFRNHRAAHHLKERPAFNAGADRARRELNSRVMQWLVLCGIPYRGSGALASPDPANQLPFSHLGQATRPPGSSTAHLQLSKSSTCHSCLQIAFALALNRCLPPAENSNLPALRQARRPVESSPNLWETPGAPDFFRKSSALPTILHLFLVRYGLPRQRDQ